VVLAGLINLVSPVVPVRLSADWQRANLFAKLYREGGVGKAYPRVIAAHPGVFYFLDRDLNGDGRRDAFTGARVREVPAGAVLVWDPVYCTTNAIAEDAAGVEQIRGAGWGEDEKLTGAVNEGGVGKGWVVFRSSPFVRH